MTVRVTIADRCHPLAVVHMALAELSGAAERVSFDEPAEWQGPDWRRGCQQRAYALAALNIRPAVSRRTRPPAEAKRSAGQPTTT